MSNPEDELTPKDSTADASDAPEDVTLEEVIEGEVLDASTADNGESAELEGADQMTQALADVEKFKDVALRAEAEVQNIRRRAERDVENAHKFGLESFLQNLLPVVDSIEKAIDAIEQSGLDAKDPVIEGMRLCHKLLIDVLAKEKVEVIDPVGEPFDPNLHQAMSMVENPDVEPNSVVVVIQKGYQLNSRLVRPAMVMVSKAPTAQDKAPAAQDKE